ncbi:hypothetical protein A6R68_16712 [Neotoma lepida]|uniref:Uncharacterized protein n=1 Tax=Neotoma lepida TaxID=56216 RepID=A0A1A6HGT3_NEOLE|nr:hypothetical protein A6R68_16712 [Neotoma lepida]
MVVTWVPEETEKNISPTLWEELTGKLLTVCLDVSVPFSILAHEKTMTAPEMKIELAKMRKNLPPEKTRPDSAISSKMYLTIHPVTLQRPSLRYPEQVRKLQYNLKKREDISGPESSDYRKQQKQQQRKVTTSTEKQEAEEAKSDVEDQHSIYVHCWLYSANNDFSEFALESERAQAPMEDSAKYDLSYYYYTDYPASPEGRVIYKEVSDQDETVVEMLTSSQSTSFSSISGIMDKTNWNPDLKLLRILQAGAEEDEGNHLSRAQSEASLDA